MKSKRNEFNKCKANTFVLVMAISKDEYDEYGYVFDVFKDEEQAKKELAERGVPVETYKLFKCNHIKNIRIKQTIVEGK